MQIPGHILSGWLIGNAVPLSKHERVWCLFAAAAADLDGLGLFISANAFVDYHHVLGHNWLAAVILSIIAAACFKRRLRMASMTLVLMHVHFALDMLGSGKHWGVAYNYPFSVHKYSWSWGWELHAWQNFCAMGCILIATIIIGYKNKRTPFELLVPAVDKHLFKQQKNNEDKNQ